MPQSKATLAHSIRDLYDRDRWGTAIAIDGFLDPKEFKRWLDAGVLGQTSNQTLFLKKVKAGEFDDDIAALHETGKSPADIFNTLYNREAKKQADMLAQNIDIADSLHFSRETDATHADDAEAIIQEAMTIQAISPWILVKLANVGRNPEAIRAMIADALVRSRTEVKSDHGPTLLHPNITLVFGAHHYLNTVAGYLEGLEALQSAGADITTIRSVNSLFVSRLDRVVDELINESEQLADGQQANLLRHLCGKTAIAQAKKIYQMSRAVFFGEPFNDPNGLFTTLHGQIEVLRDRFARLRQVAPDAPSQRLLIASSSNKNPGEYSDLVYVLPFLGAHIGNTLPVETVEALHQHLIKSGVPVRDTINDPLPWIAQNADTIEAWEEAVKTGQGYETKSADEVLALVRHHALEPNKMTLETIADELRDKGAVAFAKDQQAAYDLFSKKVDAIAG